MFDGPWESCMFVRGLNPSECASWVQAWGAIGAIFASAALALVIQRREATRERAAKHEEDVRLLKIIGQFVFDVRAKLRDIDEHDIPYLHHNWTAIDETMQSLRAIPFDKYPAEQPAFAVATSLTSYRFLRDARDKLGLSAGSTQQANHIDKSRQHARDGFFRAEQEIEAALVLRGSSLPKMQIDFENGVSIRTLEPDPI